MGAAYYPNPHDGYPPPLDIDEFSNPAAGGVGGSGTQQVFQDLTAGTPDDPTLPAVSFPTGGGTLSQWDVASQTWV